jgi:hypothetical protein
LKPIHIFLSHRSRWLYRKRLDFATIDFTFPVVLFQNKSYFSTAIFICLWAKLIPFKYEQYSSKQLCIYFCYYFSKVTHTTIDAYKFHLINRSRQAVVCAHYTTVKGRCPLTVYRLWSIAVIYCFYPTVTIMAKRKS